MPNYKLQVIFSGACAFVPKRGDGKAMWVLLPAIDKPGALAKNVPLHKSILKFDLQNLRNGPPVPNSTFGIWPLASYELRIKPNAMEIGGENLNIVGFSDIGRDLMTAEGSAPSARSFAWVAPVEFAGAKRGFAGTGRVFAELVDPKIAPDPEKFAARVFLNFGTVFSEISRVGGKIVVWRFRPFEGQESANDHRQAVASCVTLEQEFKSEEVPFVEFTAKKFGPYPPGSPLQLAPTAEQLSSADPILKVEVMNEEGAAIVQAVGPSGVQLKQARKQDQVFEAFYTLSPFSPPEAELPIPVPEHFLGRSGDNPIAVASPPCSPARMEPF